MVLVVLIMLAEGVNAFLPLFIKDVPFDASAFEEEVHQFELAMWAPDTNERVEEKYETKKQTYATPKKTYKKKAGPVRPPLMIEINTADSAQLTKLYGIGPSFAVRILKYRRLLGGFFSVEQLLEVFGMDSIRYAGIYEHVYADASGIRKISVNEAEFKALLKHPYLDYETVKLICNYREYTRPITCGDTLRLVIGYDPMFEKVKHYIEYRIANIE
jgi:DNA uptake protein ComE-like DNA-binding protein